MSPMLQSTRLDRSILVTHASSCDALIWVSRSLLPNGAGSLPVGACNSFVVPNTYDK